MTDSGCSWREILTPIEEGMEVMDVAGQKIGRVTCVCFGDEGSTESEFTATSPVHDVKIPNSFLLKVVETLFGGDTLSNEMEVRLMREGYIRIDRGLFGCHRFALPNQIALVKNQCVALNVPYEELVSM